METEKLPMRMASECCQGKSLWTDRKALRGREKGFRDRGKTSPVDLNLSSREEAGVSCSTASCVKQASVVLDWELWGREGEGRGGTEGRPGTFPLSPPRISGTEDLGRNGGFVPGHTCVKLCMTWLCIHLPVNIRSHHPS